MDVWEIIQYLEIEPGSGIYNKDRFAQAVKEMPTEQFSRFCREYLHLMEFYSEYKLMWFTDDSDIGESHPAVFHKPGDLDFDAPIEFRRVL